MELIENKVYKNYIEEVFIYFRELDLHEGQGGFILRNLLSKHNELGESRYRMLLFTIYNLVDTGYLVNDDNFFKLTQKGFDFLQGGEIICNQINFLHFIDTKDTTKNIFNQLWSIIGVKETAPFYVSGSVFLKTISPYLSGVINNYSMFMEDLKKEGLSQSRILWYRNLFMDLSAKQRELFLEDLSKEISMIYKPTSLEKEPEEKIMESIFDGLVVKEKLGEKVEERVKLKKKIFITYCWETDIDKKHIEWVYKLAQDLSKDFDIIIDVKQPLGIELNQFMEQTIHNCEKVLIIATPEYKRRADNRLNGVGYETIIITNDLVSHQNCIKFIPIIRKGNKDTSYPLYLGNRKGLDMTNDEDYDQALSDLIFNLKNY